jgi:hypothetical protein
MKTCTHNYIRYRSFDPCSRTEWICEHCSCCLPYFPKKPVIGEHTTILNRPCRVCCRHEYVDKYSPFGNYLECTKCQQSDFNR